MDVSITDNLRHNDRCQELARPDIGNFVLSWFILLGILISYIPQHYRIIHRRTSEGISPWFVLLGTTSGTSAIANILTLPTSREDIACCKVNTGFSCAAGLLGVAQVGVQWSCFFIITFLFLIFVPRQGLRRHANHDVSEVPMVPTNDFWQKALGVVAIAIIHFIMVFIISVIMLGAFPKYLQIWANILGIMGALLASTQYLPQIHTTYLNKDIGSFSIPMMLIQTPGSFVFAGSLAIRLGAGGWSAWTVYLVTGLLQGILLAMALVYSMRDRRGQRRKSARAQEYSDEDLPNEDEEDENDPLIISQNIHERAKRRVSNVRNPLDPRRLDPEPSSDEDEDTTGTLRGSGSNHTFSRVASTLAERFGIGSQSASRQHSRQPSKQIQIPSSPPSTQVQVAGSSPSRTNTQWYDTQSRRESQVTGTTPPHEPTMPRAESPFTTASRSASSAGSTVTAFHNPGRQTPQNGSPNGAGATWPASQPLAASSAGQSRANGNGKEQERSKSTAQ